MKTLSKLTIEDFQKEHKDFLTFFEMKTEYRIVKITPAIFNRYYLQFKDHYRILGIRTPLTVWRFIPKCGAFFKKHDCPIRCNPSLLSPLFLQHMISPSAYVYVFDKQDKKHLKEFTQTYPVIDLYLEKQKLAYEKKNADNVEYL